MRTPFQADREKMIGIAFVLIAILAGLLLRVPAHPLMSYGPSIEFRTHRAHVLPSFAIVSDIFCAAVLVSFPVSLAATRIEAFIPVVISAAPFSSITTLRC